MLARMDGWSYILRWAYDFRLEAWVVAASALLLAWLHRNAKARELKDYDAWWLHYARRNKMPWPSLRARRRR